MQHIPYYLKSLLLPHDPEVEYVKAPTQLQNAIPIIITASSSNNNDESYELDENIGLLPAGATTVITTPQHQSPVDYLISLSAKWAGTINMFVLMCLVLFVWVVYGIISNGSDKWQILMQDGQSIQTYIWDTLLMRQQLDDSLSFLKLFGIIKSRSNSHLKLLKLIKKQRNYDSINVNIAINFDDETRIQLKEESRFDKISSKLSSLMGSLTSVTIYWSLIVVWLFCGKIPIDTGDIDPESGEPIKQKYSDQWQMIVNTGTAIVLLVTSVFLQNVRTRNDIFIRQQIHQLIEFDANIEKIERKITGNFEDNDIIKVRPLIRSGLKKWISKYADIIGTGLGLIITVLVFAGWLAVGPLMNWNSNWWLIIGTYTGLVGFIDGFVMREVYFSITENEEMKLIDLIKETRLLLTEADINVEIPEMTESQSIAFRVSKMINLICSNQWSVVVSVVSVIVLLVIATAMKWTVTGQLICNTPTMIIEGFFLLILLQAHGWADAKRRKVFDQLKLSRELLYKYVSLVLKSTTNS